MATCRELSLEEKINLIKEKEQGASHRELCEKFHVSIGAVSNILKRKCEYTDDYEANKNKKVKRKHKHDFSQEVNDNVYEWFVAQRA
jgi:transposase